MTLIEIDWKGPFTIEETVALNTDIDFGVYQIYGTHNILGTDALLYLGQACDQTFAQRLPQREYITWDFPEYRIYVGRFGSSQSCSEHDWNTQINYAEQIFIDYCQPPYNSQLLNGLSESVPSNINLLNFGKRHKLPFAITTTWKVSSFHNGQWKAYSNKMYSSQQCIGNMAG